MLLSPRKNGLTSLFKEFRVFKGFWGVSGSVPQSVSGALRVPGSGVSKKCPESVPGVSGTPFFDTPRTLSGHFLDTLEPGARRARRHSVGDSRRLSRRHFGPEGPERPCSRPGKATSSRQQVEISTIYRFHFIASSPPRHKAPSRQPLYGVPPSTSLGVFCAPPSVRNL